MNTEESKLHYLFDLVRGSCMRRMMGGATATLLDVPVDVLERVLLLLPVCTLLRARAVYQ